VDIFGLLLDSAVFLVRRGSEEDGAKLVVRLKQDDDSSRAERRGEGRDDFSRHKARKKTALDWNVRPGLTDLGYAQNLWDGCFRGGYSKNCSPSGSTTDASNDCLAWEQ
jgi:hypothetical protein